MRRLHSWANGQPYLRLHVALEKIGSPLVVLSGGPTIAIPPHDAPQPDVVLLEKTDNPGYATVADVYLVGEASDPTLRRHLTTTRDLYARAGIREYWVVDINKGDLHQFWSPVDGVYADNRTIPLAGPIAGVTLPDLVIDGSGIL